MPPQQREKFFHRHQSNPILTTADWPYPAHSVYNPGATRLPDGTTVLLCRVEDYRGISHLCVARSPDGIGDWTIDPKPTFMPDPQNHPEETWGMEDPRITFAPELGKYVVTYAAVTRGGPGVALATTEDFCEFERYGDILPPEDKDAALLPRRINGHWMLVHRPVTPLGSHIWISNSPDLHHWGAHRVILEAREHTWWDALKIGLSTPLVETPQGWLMIYHGVRNTASGSIYRVGLALFDLENPDRCLRRGKTWIFGPKEPYEREGDVSNVVFPTGYTISPDGDTLNMYYGAADTCIALATASIRQLLDWLKRHGEPEQPSSWPGRLVSPQITASTAPPTEGPTRTGRLS